MGTASGSIMMMQISPSKAVTTSRTIAETIQSVAIRKQFNGVTSLR